MTVPRTLSFAPRTIAHIAARLCPPLSVTIGQLRFGIIAEVSGWGVLRWAAYRHQDGLGPTPSGPRPFAFGALHLTFLLSNRYEAVRFGCAAPLQAAPILTRMVDGAFPPAGEKSCLACWRALRPSINIGADGACVT